MVALTGLGGEVFAARAVRRCRVVPDSHRADSFVCAQVRTFPQSCTNRQLRKIVWDAVQRVVKIDSDYNAENLPFTIHIIRANSTPSTSTDVTIDDNDDPVKFRAKHCIALLW